MFDRRRKSTKNKSMSLADYIQKGVSVVSNPVSRQNNKFINLDDIQAIEKVIEGEGFQTTKNKSAIITDLQIQPFDQKDFRV
jgi:hypothetical protein